MTRLFITLAILLDATLSAIALIYAAPIVWAWGIHIITTALNGGTQ